MGKSPRKTIATCRLHNVKVHRGSPLRYTTQGNSLIAVDSPLRSNIEGISKYPSSMVENTLKSMRNCVDAKKSQVILQEMYSLGISDEFGNFYHNDKDATESLSTTGENLLSTPTSKRIEPNGKANENNTNTNTNPQTKSLLKKITRWVTSTTKKNVYFTTHKFNRDRGTEISQFSPIQMLPLAKAEVISDDCELLVPVEVDFANEKQDTGTTGQVQNQIHTPEKSTETETKGIEIFSPTRQVASHTPHIFHWMESMGLGGNDEKGSGPDKSKSDNLQNLRNPSTIAQRLFAFNNPDSIFKLSPKSKSKSKSDVVKPTDSTESLSDDEDLYDLDSLLSSEDDSSLSDMSDISDSILTGFQGVPEDDTKTTNTKPSLLDSISVPLSSILTFSPEPQDPSLRLPGNTSKTLMIPGISTPSRINSKRDHAPKYPQNQNNLAVSSTKHQLVFQGNTLVLERVDSAVTTPRSKLQNARGVFQTSQTVTKSKNVWIEPLESQWKVPNYSLSVQKMRLRQSETEMMTMTRPMKIGSVNHLARRGHETIGTPIHFMTPKTEPFQYKWDSDSDPNQKPDPVDQTRTNENVDNIQILFGARVTKCTNTCPPHILKQKQRENRVEMPPKPKYVHKKRKSGPLDAGKLLDISNQTQKL